MTSGHLLLFTVMFVTWVSSNRKQSHYELEAGISTSGKEREQELVKSRGQEPTSTGDSRLVVNIAISSTRSWCAPRPHRPGPQGSILQVLNFPTAFKPQQ